MGKVTIANLPNTSTINPRNYVIVEKPGEGEGTFKSTVGDLQKAITVTANVTQVDNITTIYIKDINGETSAEVFTPVANVTAENNIVVIEIEDAKGLTRQTLFNPIVNVSRNANVVKILATDFRGTTQEEVFSPIADVINEDGTVTISIEDYRGTAAASFKIPKATVVDNQDGTSTITIVDDDGETTDTIISHPIVDPEPTPGSDHFITSGTLYDIIQQLQQQITVDTDIISQLSARIANLEAKETVTLVTEEDVDLPAAFDVNGQVFKTLSEAIKAVSASGGGSIVLDSDASNEGISVPGGSNIDLDLNGHTLDITGPGAGSHGTETNGMQLLKDSNIIIRNGVLNFNDSALKMGIQNYSDLTLDNVQVSGGPTIQYVVSNNFGTVRFRNGTIITPSEGQVAFDAWYGMNIAYDAGVNVIIEDDSVMINGKVEFGKAPRASAELFAVNASITCPSAMNLNVNILNPPSEWSDNGDGTKTLRYAGA